MDILRRAKEEGRKVLTEIESKEVLKEAGIPVLEARLARTKKEAVALAREIGLPVVLKVVSPDITHKSDVGGVKVGLKSIKEVERAYSEIKRSAAEKVPGAEIWGVSVQKMAPRGVELIIGMTKDEQFGPVIMFGLGGIFVEVLKDVSFRIVPLTRRDASEMIREIKGFPILEGYRGEPVDISAIEDMIMKLSEFAYKNEDVKEIDMNPVFAYRDKAFAVDARIVLE